MSSEKQKTLAELDEASQKAYIGLNIKAARTRKGFGCGIWIFGILLLLGFLLLTGTLSLGALSALFG